MVVVEARKLQLPPQSSSSLSSPRITSLLSDPTSLSLALMHSDSSFSLYPSLSPFSISSLPPPPTRIPSPSSSATFLRLHTHPFPNSTPRLLFLVSSPHLSGAAVLLHFWILRDNNSFTKARVISNQRDLKFEENRLAVVFSVNHGVSIKLVGSINVFAMYSVSNSKIWVFAVKMAGDEEDGVDLKLMMCAVIDCSVPVFSIRVSFGFLILGEDNGVRVFPLRPLVKGRVKKNCRRVNKNLNGVLDSYKLEGQRLNLPNGVIHVGNESDEFYCNSAVYRGVSGCSGNIMDAQGSKQISSNGLLEEKNGQHLDPVKLRCMKLRQDSREGGACFVAFKSKEIESLNSTKRPLTSAKAVSIQVLSPNKFLILDSVGDLYLLCMSNPVLGSEVHCHMKQLSLTMKVQKLAVLPDISTRSQIVWMSDGHHTVHSMVVSDMDTSVSEGDIKDNEEKLMQISAIFANEKIQEIVPLASNTILILGQGSIFAYAMS